MISKLDNCIIVSIFCILNLSIVSVFGQDANNTKNIIDLNSIPVKQVKVGDIVISYKIFGNGEPILLIMGYGGSMNFWDPILLSDLSKNHQVIVFDNRDIGNSTLGTKNYTINQLTEDSIELLNVLNISKSDILGYSMGGMIAQQLILNYPDKVDDLILYATSCGGKNSSLADQQVLDQLLNKSGSNEDKKKRWIPLQLTDEWIQQNPNYMKKFVSLKYLSNQTLERQDKAIFDWFKLEYVIN